MKHSKVTFLKVAIGFLDSEKRIALWKQCLGKPGHVTPSCREGVLWCLSLGTLDVCACCLLPVDVGPGNGLSQVRAVTVEIKSSLPLL